MATSILGEEPRFGTTPLAMLAATCNKIGNTSPLTTLPESSAFAKGGFHPWKRSSSSCNLGSSLSGFAVATGGRGSGGLAGGSGAANSAFCLASTSPTSSAFSSDYGGLFSNSAAAAAAAAGVSPQEAGGQSAFISKVHTTAADGLYPRVGMAHPYESWYKSGFHSTLAAGEVTNGAASSWWDVHSSPGSWLEVQNPAGGLQSSLHSGAPQASLHSQLGTYNPDFSSLTHSAFSSTGLGSSAAAASHLLSTSQHLLAQDGFKPVLPSYSDSSAAVAAAAASRPGERFERASRDTESEREVRRASERGTDGRGLQGRPRASAKCSRTRLPGRCSPAQPGAPLCCPSLDENRTRDPGTKLVTGTSLPSPPRAFWARPGRLEKLAGVRLLRGRWAASQEAERGCPARLGTAGRRHGGESVVGFPEEGGARASVPGSFVSRG
ncbi:transcription factor Sp9 [Suricata suricatta]|uniref:transcription factor Sp9 n=1 Tax=Suricata suricatta TaxID=37032 RepID=UPI00115555C8|nr:transcription factor Sp9 [Suricata suricatta]